MTIQNPPITHLKAIGGFYRKSTPAKNGRKVQKAGALPHSSRVVNVYQISIQSTQKIKKIVASQKWTRLYYFLLADNDCSPFARRHHQINAGFDRYLPFLSAVDGLAIGSIDGGIAAGADNVYEAV